MVSGFLDYKMLRVGLLPLLLFSLSLPAITACGEKDIYKPLLEGEDLGTGVRLNSLFSEVPKTIEQTLGKAIAEHQISTDKRYYEFADTYLDYSIIITDMDQNGKVDSIIVYTWDKGKDGEEKALLFPQKFPKIKTKTGITLGSTRQEVINAYTVGDTIYKGTGWIESSAGNLRFTIPTKVVTEIFLATRKAKNEPLGALLRKMASKA